MKNIFDVAFENGPVTCVFGGSLGDEGKGKVSSALETTKGIDYVAVSTGGANAGHNVVYNGKKIALHELPGGAIIPDAKVYLGQGRVINIGGLSDEINLLNQIGCDKKHQLIIAGNAQLILNTLQRKLDKIIEDARANKVGTTKKGIGPAYALKDLRIGINFNELLYDKLFVEDKLLTACELFSRLNYDEVKADLYEQKELLLKLIDNGEVSIDTTNMLLNQESSKGKKILIEASQSALLAIDGGMYPNCTSSDTSLNGALSALNLLEIHNGIAVMKAVKSKVGSGNFPTKFSHDIAVPYRKAADEFGATTGRPRDVGYFDAVESRYVLSKNKTSVLFLTKVDLLNQLPEVKIGIGYKSRSGQVYTDYIPTLQSEYEGLEVEYSPSFILKEDIGGMVSKEQLPESYKQYFDYLIDIIGFKGRVIIGTGPKPHEFIIYQ